ncbi:Branched-chain amino acid aminotransferase II [Penicillium malachiteum]|uniref:Branched-chain amino acid aminotransferase II n=1 Tax=Penicillium malachiteum TaxID=1324776 RepID=UPI00254720B0|nr:Branched-chain amino acid aminotransferase II [Penicillium malachiteum]KAJ5715517.1 Branched-chain amino acid aminotransferase II [Penicillium malachiteum]
MTFPPSPAPNVEWTKLGFAVSDLVNGHIESTYSVDEGIWSPLKLVADPYLRIHGLAPALNYGQQVYEGLKAYRTRNGKIQIFRPYFHAARMQHSADVVSIPPVPIDHFITAVNAAVEKNAEWVPPYESGASMYIRPVLFGSSGHFALTPPAEYTFCVYVQPFSTYHGVMPLPAVTLEEFDRAAPKGTGHAKIGGKTGEDIDEFSTSGFMGVRVKKQEGEPDQVTLVVPKSDNIINSVTSDSLMALARQLGYEVEHRTVKYTELSSFSEVMAVGTAAALVPIRSITHQSRGDNFVYTTETAAGPVCQKLHSELISVQRGDSEDNEAWCYEVKQVLNGVNA